MALKATYHHYDNLDDDKHLVSHQQTESSQRESERRCITSSALKSANAYICLEYPRIVAVAIFVLFALAFTLLLGLRHSPHRDTDDSLLTTSFFVNNDATSSYKKFKSEKANRVTVETNCGKVIGVEENGAFVFKVSYKRLDLTWKESNVLLRSQYRSKLANEKLCMIDNNASSRHMLQKKRKNEKTMRRRNVANPRTGDWEGILPNFISWVFRPEECCMALCKSGFFILST